MQINFRKVKKIRQGYLILFFIYYYIYYYYVLLFYDT